MVLEDFEKLNDLMAGIDRKHGVGEEDITQQYLRRFIDKRSLKPLLKRAGLRQNACFHDLRHT